MDELTPEQRRLRASIAAHMKWASTSSRKAATAKARQAFADSFEHQVDPDRKLTPEERARRANNARSAFYKQMAYRSAQAKQERRAAKAARAEQIRRAS